MVAWCWIHFGGIVPEVRKIRIIRGWDKDKTKGRYLAAATLVD